MISSDFSIQIKTLHELRDQLSSFKNRIIDHEMESIRAQLKAVESIKQTRPKVRDLITELSLYTGDEVIEFSEHISNAPLFHPLYESLLEEKAEAKDEADFFQTKRIELKEDLNLMVSSPYPSEKQCLLLMKEIISKQSETVEKAISHCDIACMYQILSEEEKAQLPPNLLKIAFKSQEERFRDDLEMINESIYAQDLQTGRYDEVVQEFLNLEDFLQRLKTALEESVQQQQTSTSLNGLIKELEEVLSDVAPSTPGLDDIFENPEMDFLVNQFFDSFTDEADDYEEQWSPIAEKELKFPVESIVAITQKNWLPLHDFKAPEDARGRVKGGFKNAHTGENFYEVELDSITLQQLPIKYIQYICEDGEETFAYHLISGEALKKSVARDTQLAAHRTHKELFNRYFWGDIQKDEDAKNIYNILMAKPDARDIDNWHQHFKQSAFFPFDAIIEGIAHSELPSNAPVQVLGIADLSTEEESELMAIIEIDNLQISYPLIDLLPKDENSKAGKAQLLYRDWADLLG